MNESINQSTMNQWKKERKNESQSVSEWVSPFLPSSVADADAVAAAAAASELNNIISETNK